MARTREPRLFQEERDQSHSSSRQGTARERIKGDMEGDNVIRCHGLSLTVENYPVELTGYPSPDTGPSKRGVGP